MTQDLIAAGAPLPAVTQPGRWASPQQPARYARRLGIELPYEALET